MTHDEWIAGAPERERDLALESVNRRRAEVGLPAFVACTSGLYHHHPKGEPCSVCKTPEEELARDLDAVFGAT